MGDGFIVSIGGSGSKVIECLLHMFAIDMENRYWPDNVHILVIETDAANGNLKRLKAAENYYQNIQMMLTSVPFFRTHVRLYYWQPVIAGNANDNCLHASIAGQQDAKLLGNLLFTQEEINHQIDVGFQGHPSIGSVFFQQLLDEAVANDSVQAFVEAANSDINTDDKVDIMVAGSIFGGTGATGIPLIQPYLRENITKPVRFGLLMMLPSFRLPKAQVGAEMEICSNRFNEKVKTVLAYYADHHLITTQQKPAYDSVCLLGYNNPIPFEKYQIGDDGQLNPSTIIDWYGCLAVQQFFRRDKDEEESDVLRLRTGLYLSAMNNAQWTFHQMDKVFPTLQRDVTAMLQIASVFLNELCLALRNLTVGEVNARPMSPRIILARYRGTLIDFFNDWDGKEAQHLREVYEPFLGYMQMYVDWLFQILSHIPVDYPRDIRRAALIEFHLGKERIQEDYFSQLPNDQLQALMMQFMVRARYIVQLEKDARIKLVPERPVEPIDETRQKFSESIFEALNTKVKLPLNEMTYQTTKPAIDTENVLGHLWRYKPKGSNIDNGTGSCIALLSALMIMVKDFHTKG